VRKIHELGRQGVQFATFPETVVPYYPYFSFVQSPYQIIVGPEYRKLLDQAVTVPSPATNAIGDACRQAGVVVSIGVNEGGNWGQIFILDIHLLSLISFPHEPPSSHPV
jgi:aliphatic nitrilase